MHAQEKQAWFIMLVFLTLVVSALIWGGISGFRWEIFYLASLYPLVGLGPLIIFKGKRTTILMDERDQAIVQKATLTSFWIIGGIFYFAVLSSVLLLRGEGKTLTIPTEAIPFIPLFGLIIWFTARALGIICLYRRVGDGRAE